MYHTASTFLAGLLGAVLCFGGIAPAAAQQSDAADSDTSGRAMPIMFADGMNAMQDGDEREAAQLLQQVMLRAPGYRDAQRGSAAYWLGKAYAESGQIDRALQAWRLGLIALHNAEHFEVRLADAYVRAVFRYADAENYRLAADAYLRMLQHLDEQPTPSEAAVLVPHLARLKPIVPEHVLASAGLPTERITPQDVTRATSKPLIAWWRSEDPLPATLENERLIEHLERVAHAEEHYASNSSSTGFDARGEIYLRYGEPQHKEVLRFNETRLTDELFRPGVSVNLSDFPMNAFWSYGDIDRSGYYLFVKGDEGYRLGRFDELLPRSLQSGFTSSPRGQRRSYLALAAMRAMYRRLSPYHPDLAVRHDEVANYLAQVTGVGVMSENEIDTDRSLSTQTRPAATFAEKTLRENRNRDRVAERTRQRSMPKQKSAVLREAEELHIAARTARFLDEDGTTRTEVYWSPLPEAMQLSTDQREDLDEQGYSQFDQFLIRMTAAQKNADYQKRVVNQKHYRIDEIASVDGGTIPAQTLKVHGDTTLHHLAMQWDQYLIASDEPGGARIGPRLKIGTMREDSITALTSDEQVLEMSDLRAMIVPPGAPPTALEQAVPYPLRQINPEMTMALYFEVYHLAFDEADQTRYTVEYEVQRQAPDGRLVRLFRGDETPSTSMEAQYEGQSRTANEYILLDLSAWEGERDLTVTVRVTDAITGQQVERSIEFEATR
jgi:GWxTD domain-containing protein